MECGNTVAVTVMSSVSDFQEAPATISNSVTAISQCGCPVTVSSNPFIYSVPVGCPTTFKSITTMALVSGIQGDCVTITFTVSSPLASPVTTGVFDCFGTFNPVTYIGEIDMLSDNSLVVK
jgi:hypothetical protein